MYLRLRVFIVCLFAALPACRAEVVAAPAGPSGFEAGFTLPYLASGGLGGGGGGTAGLDEAADFLAEPFREAGLKPLPGMTDYFQRFDWVMAAKPSEECSLTRGREGLKLGVDYVPLGISAQGGFDGLVVFAGYGIT